MRYNYYSYWRSSLLVVFWLIGSQSIRKSFEYKGEKSLVRKILSGPFYQTIDNIVHAGVDTLYYRACNSIELKNYLLLHIT